ncbi:cytochrome P450 [Frankia sp. CNm7]|uniref:Cytochrome P450 n=1 Tax=Frankia nepalensis TaxID=1836974 RepID=A0A937UNF3_9ACTN|nr:cytochrome P450 [Frankia nepalensis]MBL7501632.1 cytochrome P450 [Frankia nepalensis]MBL7516001.1 cytochrome P450 [Frankia nepalensis]MBL7519041.1 cytochrome P450 [Frankia nepalensis]MBL7628033.1 cytochrome P450 [Frankia nepalensis]
MPDPVATADRRRDGRALGCPVASLAHESAERPALQGFREFDALRERGPLHYVNAGRGNYVVVGYEEALAVAQDWRRFPQSRYLFGVNGEPGDVVLIPESLDGPPHTAWRRLLAPYWSPAAVGPWEPAIRRHAVDIISAFKAKGGCDLVTEFALRFPPTVFLEIMGLPVADLDRMLVWKEHLLHPDTTDPAAAKANLDASLEAIIGYFLAAMAARRATAPEDRPPGLVTEALTWELDGEPVSDADLLSFYMLMFLAGLDTVTAELGYGFLHLATHPEDRRRIAADPAVVPKAVEELLRAYPIVNVMRDAAEDTEINGCPVYQGDTLTVSLPAAGRDGSMYPNATEVDFDRERTTHLTFGAGPHRCLGSHLARLELRVAYEEWHRLIPEYELDAAFSPVEASGLMFTLNTLRLRWPA